MGIFDFVKDAGADDLTKTVEVSPERIEELRRENIARKVAKLDIDGEQVLVRSLPIEAVVEPDPVERIDEVLPRQAANVR